jgi:bromodomain adjacent to zinc finger domain protein 1A
VGDREQRQKVRGLACAILQVAQMVQERFFKPPLGEDEKEKKKRLKEEERRRKDREEGEDDADQQAPQQTTRKILTPLENWENSLMKCTSYAQLLIHLTTLENSIIWSK